MDFQFSSGHPVFLIKLELCDETEFENRTPTATIQASQTKDLEERTKRLYQKNLPACRAKCKPTETRWIRELSAVCNEITVVTRLIAMRLRRRVKRIWTLVTTTTVGGVWAFATEALVGLAIYVTTKFAGVQFNWLKNSGNFYQSNAHPAGRKIVVAAAQEATEKGGEERVENFIGS